MIEIINNLESKGFHICVHPRMDNGVWYWSAGVYIGDNRVAEWVDCNNGLPRACYKTYREAFDAVVNYCEKYTPPRVVNIEKSSKRQRRNRT